MSMSSTRLLIAAMPGFLFAMAETIPVVGGGEPLLARWRLGLGQTAAFTSDVKNRWGVQWLRWPGYARFWAQVVRSLMRHRLTEAFDLRTEVQGGRVRVVIDAINQLESGLSDLAWLPAELPGSVRLVVSLKRGGADAEALLEDLQAELDSQAQSQGLQS